MSSAEYRVGHRQVCEAREASADIMCTRTDNAAIALSQLSAHGDEKRIATMLNRDAEPGRPCGTPNKEQVTVCLTGLWVKVALAM